MRAQEWLDRHGVSFDWSANGYQVDSDGWEHQDFTIELHHDPNATYVAFPWKQGMLVDDVPTPNGVLPLIARDIQSGDMSWEGFAGEFGYDALEAPLSAYRTWEACRAMRDDFAAFCADQDMFGAFLLIREDEDQ